MSTWNASTQAYSDCAFCKGKGYKFITSGHKVCWRCLQRRVAELEAAKAEAALWSLSGEVFSQQTLKLAAAEMVIESGKAYIAELQAERAAALRTALEVIASNDLRLLAAYMREHNIATRDHYVAAIREVAKSALASTTAGADLLAQLRQAEAQRDALVEAAKPIIAEYQSDMEIRKSANLELPVFCVECSSDNIHTLAAVVKATEGGE